MEYRDKLGFRSTNGPLQDVVLEQFELQLAVPLPQDYREFLQQRNGGVFDDDATFPFKDQEDDEDNGKLVMLAGLFDPNRNNDLRRLSLSYGFRSNVPSNYIAIGDSAGWDMWCISIGGTDCGSVHYWQPGEPWPKDPPSSRFLRRCADSFTEFWNGLRPQLS